MAKFPVLSISGKWFYLLMVLLIPGPVLADDTMYGGSAAGIYPIKTEDVSLVREVVTFTEVSEWEYEVNALLVFRNESGKNLKAQVGFPDVFGLRGEGMVMEEGPGEDYKPDIRDLAVYVDGVPVRGVKFKQLTWSEEQPWFGVYLFEMEFPRRGLVTVLHQYRLMTSNSAGMESFLPYIFKTGANWKGSIETAIFEFRFLRPKLGLKVLLGNERIMGMDYYHDDAAPILKPLSKAKAGADYDFEYVGGRIPRLTLTFRNIEPAGDLVLGYLVGGYAGHMLRGIPSTPGQEECGFKLVNLLASDKLPEQLQECYSPEWLRTFVLASRGAKLAREQEKLLYDSGLLLRSSVPFKKEWLDWHLLDLLQVMEQKLEEKTK